MKRIRRISSENVSLWATRVENYSKSVSSPSSGCKAVSKGSPLLLTYEGVSYDKELRIVLPDTVDRSSALLVIGSITNALASLDSITKRGYIKSPVFPLLDDIIVKYFKDSEGVPVKPGFDKYEIVYNILLLNMYLLGRYVYKLLEKDGNEDLLADYDVLIKKIHQRISAVIRMKIQKRGISIKHNTYTGFDTEYYLKDEAKNLNELLSVQLALNTRFVINIPLVTPYNYKDQINPLTGSLYIGEGVNQGMSQFNECVNTVIARIRDFEYKDYDMCMLSIIKNMEGEGFSKIVSEEKSSVQFITDNTDTQTMFKLTNGKGYKFMQIVEDCDEIIKPTLYQGLVNLFKQMGLNTNLGEMSSRLYDQKSVRTTTVLGEGIKLSVSLVKNNYICCHLSTADLSVLSDFEEIKDSLDIIQKTFATLGRLSLDKYSKSNIYLRDTSLLAPSGFKSLASVGSMYGGEYEKVSLPVHYRGNMVRLLEDDPALFEKYAVQDSIVTLKHAKTMEDFQIKQGKTGVPLTLSSLGRDYILNEWRKTGYTYQNSEILLGDTSGQQTPFGLNVTGDIGLYLSHYIANYKGGRNESYMYGCDRTTSWIDYDLTSAYTTAMALLGNPVYKKARVIHRDLGRYLTKEYLLHNYVVIKTTFKFPEGVKYPSIPCFIKGGKATVYPLEGKSILTGPEYLVALNQGCKLKNEYLVVVPFETEISSAGEVVYPNKPFYNVIKIIQEERRRYPKKTINNLLYKEMGNSIYGNVVKGISNKKLFDIKTKRTLPANANALSNPILGSYITGLIRSLLGECLHNIGLLGGRIVSSTTDGFITDIADLENRLLNQTEGKNDLLNTFRKIREDLSGNPDTLEIKSTGEGIISWATRGQMGIDSSIKATTGLQTGGMDKEVLLSEFIKCMGSESKSMGYIQSRLRSGKEIYEKGGHVTMKYADRDFGMYYDNRREILDDGMSLDLTENLLDSKPLKNVTECEKIRDLKSLIKTSSYSRFSPTTLRSKKYQTVTETAVRTFIKGLLAEKPMYGLDPSLLPTYKDIISFVQGFESIEKMPITKSSISHLKSRKTIIRNVPRTPDTQKFAGYVQKKFPNFNIDEFLKKN